MERPLNFAIPALLFLFITAMLPYLPGLWYDNHDCWETWAHYIHTNGLRNAYGSGTDYMPVYQYFLWIYGKICGTDKAIADNIPYLRCITLGFDYLGLWFVYKWIDKKMAWYALLTICILNLGYTFDTIIWGQMDGTLSALVFLAVYFVWKSNNLVATIFLVLAFNFKIQTIVIIPLWALLFLNNFLSSRKVGDMLLPLGAGAALQVLLFLPFTLGQFSLNKIAYVIIHSFNKYHSLSVKAPNMWHWLVKGVLLYKDDTQVWIMGLTYKQVGLILFFTTSLFALLPLIKIVIHNLSKRKDLLPVRRELVWTTGAMVYMLFYFFNAEMHERYCQPAFIFITAYAFFTKDFFTYILFSLMYFLTLEYSMQHLKLSNYEILLFDMRFLAVINAIIIIYLAAKIRQYHKLSFSAKPAG